MTRRFIRAIARLALALASAAGTMIASADTLDIERATLGDPHPGTPEVSTQDVRRILADGSAMLLDTRTSAEFAAGHIPGARNPAAPADAVGAVAQLTAGDKRRPLVLYCNGPFCQASRRLAEQLVAAGFTDVKRYQLGIPVWRALGGPIEVTLDGFLRVVGRDQTAVLIDARSPEEFAKGSLPGAQNLPAEQFVAGTVKQPPLPVDDFNTRVLLFGRDAGQARALADALSKRPWHNVGYVAATFETLRAAIP